MHCKIGIFLCALCWGGRLMAADLHLNELDYFEAQGLSVLAYQNKFHEVFSFIPGGMIPGVMIIEPDFPELKDSWPFLWYENEYVVDAATTFILAANAAQALAK